MAKWLEAALDYIPSWLEFQLRIHRQPGCVIAIAHRDEIVLERAFGTADLGSGEPLTPRHRFRAASHSKSYTAAGVMKLREMRKLRLDEPIGKYLSGLHPKIARLTISQLLSQSAGVTRDGDNCDYFSGRRPFPTAAELLAAFGSPPIIGPDKRFKYSNHGFGLLGLVIEAVTGEPYRSWMKREILDAIGLRETTPDMPIPDGTPFARGHTDGILLGKRVVVAGDYSTGALAPASGVVATASDTAAFYAQLSPRAKKSILSAASRREMARRRWPNLPLSSNMHYGYGTIIGAVDRWNWFGHSGGLQGYVSRTKMFPAQDLTCCVLSNSADGLPDLWVDGAVRILRAFFERGAPAANLKSWHGRWWNLWGAVDLVPIGDVVVVANPHLGSPFTDATVLKVIDRDRARVASSNGFGFYGEAARRNRNPGGEVSEIWLGGDRYLPETALAAELKKQFE